MNDERANPRKRKAPAGNANLLIGIPHRANQEIGAPGAPIWRSRGYLPHVESAGAIQHVTFHLADSLPKSVLEGLEIELNSLPPKKRAIERRKKLEAWMDAGYGSCVLRDPVIAEMVQGSLLCFDSLRYLLIAWVVMPNHVHALFQANEGWSVSGIAASWKKFTARKIRDHVGNAGNANLPSGIPHGGGANREIGAPGAPIWHREFWDRYVRDESHLRQVIEYIHQNPVTAGLADRAEAWQWSSAHLPGNANLPIGTPQPDN